MKAICVKVVETDEFIHEYIAVDVVLNIEKGIVIRIDSFGFPQMICEVDSEFFREHFKIALEECKGCTNCTCVH